MVKLIIPGEQMNTTRSIEILVIATLLPFLVRQNAVAAGERTNIRGMGMAGTFVATSRGLDAVGINPANLALPDDGMVTLSIMPIGVHVGSDFMTYGLYSSYFTGVDSGGSRVGRYLNDVDKQNILNAFPDGVGRIGASVEVRPVGLSVRLGDLGIVALTMTEQVSAYAKLPHEYAQFLLYGNPPGSVYDFSQTSGKASWTREYALSFGTKLPDMPFLESASAGVAVKVVHGFGYYEVDHFNTKLITSNDGILNGTIDVLTRTSGIDAFQNSGSEGFNPFPAPAGSGLGFDLGVAGAMNEWLRFGLSVTDIGSIEWTSNVKEMSADSTIVVDDPTDAAQRDAIENAVNGKSRDGGSFSTSLPTTLRLGFAVEVHKMPFVKEAFWGELEVGIDYNQGFQETPGSTRAARFSIGAEFRPWRFLPLRTGVSFGGTDHSSFAFGFGLHFVVLDIDVASENLNWLISPDTFSYGSVAVGIRFRI